MMDNCVICFYSSKCSIKYFSEYLLRLCEIWWKLAACFNFVVFLCPTTPSGTDKQRAGWVSTKSAFFFSLQTNLHQLSVVSCQESCSSNECIEETVPTLHFNMIIIPQVFSLRLFLNFLSINGRHGIISGRYLCKGCSTCCGAQKIHRKVWMRKN